MSAEFATGGDFPVDTDTMRYWVHQDSLDPIVPVPDGQTHVRLRFVAGDGNTLRINSAYIGHGETPDDPFPNPEYQWQAQNLVQITFNGGANTSIVIPAGTTQLSDPIPFVYDGVSPLIISVDCPPTGASREQFTNFQMPGTGMQPWRIPGEQKASQLTVEDSPGVPYVVTETIGYMNDCVRMVDIFEWGVDTEATTPVEVYKLNAYAVIKELQPVAVSKLTGYAVVAPAIEVPVYKLNAYAIVRPSNANDAYKYSYLPVVN
jgi:hypothetical protein